MDAFTSLGFEIETIWRRRNYNEDEFSAIAANALRRSDLPSRVSPWDVVDWSLKQTELPPQRDIQAKFADPPVTVYSSPRFHIDIYFWFEGTTAIHQHAFCGAFQVLAGSSIHSWFEFERRHSVNSFFELGKMSLKLCELLEVGDVQEIRAGRSYIHSLFHLDHPSVTIVVRTDKSPLYLPQFSYEKPCLAIDPFFEEATLTKKLQILSTLFRSERPEADEQSAGLLERSDLHSSYLILAQIRRLLNSNRLDSIFTPDASKERFAKFLDVVGEEHGNLGRELRAVFEHHDLLDEVIGRRSYLTEPEHRFFLALLLNVEGRERILSLIKHRFPERDPVEKILDWVLDLSQTRVVGIGSSNALGIPDFGNMEMEVLEQMLYGKSESEISKTVFDEAGEAASDAATVAIGKLCGSALFRPLMG